MLPFNAIQDLVRDDFTATDRLIQEKLQSEVPLITEIGHHIVDSGGKRLRPLMVLLSARALNSPDQRHIHLAAIIEFVHTSTLLHDDVVDVSELRRGEPTANVVWGNAAAVLSGDFLYSRTFQLLVEINSMAAMDSLSAITNKIIEGEMRQLLNCNNPDTSIDDYRVVIENKTAILFEAACKLPAVLAGADAPIINALSEYGRHVGLAFQMVDDIMDYVVSADEMGKNAGDDLSEGKPTLPLIYAMQNAAPEEGKLIREAIEQGSVERLDDIKKILKDCGAIEHTIAEAQKEAQLAIAALAPLPENEYRSALVDLCHHATDRRH